MTPDPDRSDARGRRDELLEALSARLDGELSPAEAERLEAELARDPELRSMSDRLAALSAAVRELPELRAPDSVLAGVRREIESSPARPGSARAAGAPRHRSIFRSGSWAALFLVAALGFVWWRLEATRPGVLEGGKLAKEEGAGSTNPPPADVGLVETERAGELARGARAAGRADEPDPRTAGDALPPAEQARELAATGAADAPSSTAADARQRGIREAKSGAVGAPSRARGASPPEGRAGGAVGAEVADESRPAEELRTELAEGVAQAGGKAAGTESEVPAPPPGAAGVWGTPDGDAPELRFRSGERDAFELGARPADLTIRVAVPDGISAADLERLASALALALASPRGLEKGEAMTGAARPEAVSTGAAEKRREAVAKDAGLADAPRADLEAPPREPAPDAARDEELLPAEVELSVPAERLLAAVHGLHDWRRSLRTDGDGAPDRAEVPLPPTATGLAGAGGGEVLERSAEETILSVTVLDGLSFDADRATLDRFIAGLVSGPVPTGGAAPVSTAPAAGGGAASAASASPLRVRIVVVPDRPAEPPR